MNAFVVRLILLFLLSVTCRFTAHSITPLAVNPPGIAFFKGSWSGVLAEAKRQNKPIFLDVYTSWCPPCKRMAKEAFPNPTIGAKYNAYFINYQVDAEKGEGIAIAKQYLVASYPTALFIAPNGALIHRAVGYGGITAMIAQADHALALPRLKETLAKGDRDYAEGRRDPNFLKKYLQTRQSLNRPVDDVLDAYIDALPESELTTTESLTFVAANLQSSDTKAFDYLLKNRPPLLSTDMAKQSLARTIFGALYRVLASDFNQAVAQKDEVLLEKVIANSERNTASANPFAVRSDTLKQDAANEYRLTFFKQTKNFASYRAVAEPIVQHQLMNQSMAELSRLDSVTAVRLKNAMVFLPDSVKKTVGNHFSDTTVKNRLMSWKVAYSLNKIANTYCELGTSATDWEPALIWAERSILLFRSPEHLDTYNRLLKKLGRQ